MSQLGLPSAPVSATLPQIMAALQTLSQDNKTLSKDMRDMKAHHKVMGKEITELWAYDESLEGEAHVFRLAGEKGYPNKHICLHQGLNYLDVPHPSSSSQVTGASVLASSSRCVGGRCHASRPYPPTNPRAGGQGSCLPLGSNPLG